MMRERERLHILLSPEYLILPFPNRSGTSFHRNPSLGRCVADWRQVGSPAKVYMHPLSLLCDLITTY